MKIYHIDFIINGKKNPFGWDIYATSLSVASDMAYTALHRVYDDVVDSFEITSVSLVKCL